MKGLACAAAAALAAGGIGLAGPALSYAAEDQANTQNSSNNGAAASQARADQKTTNGAGRQDQKPNGAQKRAQEQTAFILIVPVPVTRPVAAVPDSVLAPDIEQIRDTLASATEAALTKGGFDDLMERFVDSDRNRMGRTELDDRDLTELDGRIAQIRKAWESKYGREFDIEDEAKVFGPFPVVQGEVGEHPRLAAGNLSPADRIAGNDAGDVNLDPGRDIALLSVPKSHGQPELSVLLIHELPDSWKIDVPETTSGRNLYDNLLKQLTYFGENTAKWPATEAEAYRQASHHVLAAVMGYDAKPGQPE